MNASATSAATLTLAELVDTLAIALGADYDGVRNGRVRDLPDGRTIRWYQTLGLVDRPAAFRGRIALYGARHVLQLAAIKARQRAGVPLADIRRGLAGMTDAELAGVAGVTCSAVQQLVAAANQTTTVTGVASVRFAAGDQAAPNTPRRDTALWGFQSAAAADPRPVAAPATSRATDDSTLQSLALAGPLTLVWQGRPLAQRDLDTLARLARPLVDFLASRATGSSAEPAGRPSPKSARPEPE